MMTLTQFYIDDLIKRAITEDINYIDVTSDYLLDDDNMAEADFIAKDDGILAGIDIALRTFILIDEKIVCTSFKKDGDLIKKGDVIATVKGKTKSILKAERTSLNLLQHMSGIATMTNRCVELVKGTKASIVETRKTLPGLRPIQKYAVVVGGGRNHRYNLSDAAMLKDNHIDSYESLTDAVNTLRKKVGHMVKIEVEADSFERLNEALEVKADIIMLDNMTCEQMAEAVKIANGRALLEASGNITLQNIAEVAKTGVDIISLGALTHSVKAFDISLKIKTNR